MTEHVIMRFPETLCDIPRADYDIPIKDSYQIFLELLPLIEAGDS